jgi:hypothetical protein
VEAKLKFTAKQLAQLEQAALVSDLHSQPHGNVGSNNSLLAAAPVTVHVYMISGIGAL